MMESENIYHEIIGYESVKERFCFIRYLLDHQKELRKKHVHIQRGALLYGFHGKTFMAKVFAKQTNRYICEISSMDKRGKIRSKLDSISLELKAGKECILLLLELDTIVEDSKKDEFLRCFIAEHQNSDMFILATASKKDSNLRE